MSFALVVKYVTVMLAIYIILPQVVMISLAFSDRFILAGGLFPTAPSLKWFIYWGDSIMKAVRASLIIAIPASIFSMIVGLPVAYVAARKDFRGKSLLNELILLPMIFPPFILGLQLSQLYISGPFRMMGPWLSLTIAHTIFCIPYLIRPVASALEQVDLSLEEAARSLGASGTRIFLGIDLPLIMPATIAGIIFAFSRSIGDFETTVYLASPEYMTLPIEIYTGIQTGNSMLANAIAVVANALSILVVLSFEGAIKRLR